MIGRSLFLDLASIARRPASETGRRAFRKPDGAGLPKQQLFVNVHVRVGRPAGLGWPGYMDVPGQGPARRWAAARRTGHGPGRVPRLAGPVGHVVTDGQGAWVLRPTRRCAATKAAAPDMRPGRPRGSAYPQATGIHGSGLRSRCSCTWKAGSALSAMEALAASPCKLSASGRLEACSVRDGNEAPLE